MRLSGPEVIALMFHNLGSDRAQAIPSLLCILRSAPRQEKEETCCENWKSGDAGLEAIGRTSV